MENDISEHAVDLGKLVLAHSQGEIDTCHFLETVTTASSLDIENWDDYNIMIKQFSDLINCDAADALRIIDRTLQMNLPSLMKESFYEDDEELDSIHTHCIEALKSFESNDAKSILVRYLNNSNFELFQSLDGHLSSTTWGALEEGFKVAAEFRIDGFDELVAPYLHSSIGFEYEGPMALLSIVAEAIAIMHSDDAIETLVGGLEYRYRSTLRFNERVLDVLKTLNREKVLESLNRAVSNHLSDESYESAVRVLKK